MGVQIWINGLLNNFVIEWTKKPPKIAEETLIKQQNVILFQLLWQAKQCFSFPIKILINNQC